MPPETKPCIACFEPIHAKARKCPHCLQIQTKAAALVNHPATNIIVGMLAVAMFGFFAYVFYESFHKKSFASQLAVGPSSLRASKSANETRVTCFAEITNKDTVAWSQPSLQAQFLDHAGKLIDVHYAKENFDLYPSLSATGRVSGRTNGDPAEYFSCKMSVLNAR